ncbi:MAG: STAS domain-containing protein [SAR324 cluster bacterium]|nr:STAS domain-containing protein [SAR324 cluster bacterium]
MELKFRIQGKICIIYPVGNLAGDKSSKFLSFTNSFLSKEHVDVIVVNLQEVEVIDSSGIGAIFAVYKTAATKTKEFSICQLSPYLLSTLTSMGLNNILQVFKTEDEAILDLT